MTSPSTHQFIIRTLREADRPSWQPLWEAYLRFYRAELDGRVTDSAFARLCDPASGLLGLIAVSPDGGGAGLAHLVLQPTTWDTAPTCYMEDLYVAPAARGTGLARRLIESAYELAAAGGASRVYWHTQQFNGPGRSLYDTVADLQSWVVYEHDL